MPKKIQSALTKDGYGLNKLNHLGYPHNDPYGLAEAFWKIFTKSEIKNESNNTKPKKRINDKTREVSKRSI